MANTTSETVPESEEQVVPDTGEQAEGATDPQSSIRARDKGKQVMREPEHVDVMNLMPEDLNKPLDLKVYRKWISKNIPDPTPTGISFILLDRKGGAIQANGQLPDARQLDTRLQLDSCYRIQGFGAKRTDNWQRTLENSMTLLFGRFTQAAPIQDDGFPKHYFNFAPYNEVCHRADTREPILTDYIGIMRNIGGIREFGDATTNIISRRNVEIQNLNGNTVMLTLWNELATQFPVAKSEEMEQPVIIAVSSCWAKRHAGVIQLSSTPATSTYFNPEVPEAEHIRQVYTELLSSGPSTYLQPSQPPALTQETPTEFLPLGVIMGAIPQTTAQHFKTEAFIVKIDETKGWFFNRCRSCGNPVDERLPHRHCQEPGSRPPPNYSYCFRATLADTTGSIVVACYSPAAHSLVPHINEVLPYIPEADPYRLPSIIKDLENTKHTFRLHLGKGSRRGFLSFILDDAKLIATAKLPEASTNVQETSSSTPSRPAITQQPTEITPGTISPPPDITSPAEPLLRITGASGSSSTDTSLAVQEETVPARRELFTDPDPEDTQEKAKKSRHE